MFDELKVRDIEILPKLTPEEKVAAPGVVFQTKSLDCYLANYEIKDGKLMLHGEKVKHTGHVYFYGTIGTYTALFNKGKLLAIVRHLDD